jgi:hypothetical protein
VSDDLRKFGTPDRDRVSLEQAHEVRYWTQRLGVSQERLRQAVSAAGPKVDAVEAWLRR